MILSPPQRASGKLPPAVPTDSDARVVRLTTYLTQPQASWRQALVGLQLSGKSDADRSGPSVLIDEAALSSVGIQPQMLVWPHRPSAVQAGLGDILRASGLVLIVAPNHILLTASDFVQLHRGQLSPAATKGVWYISGETLKERFANDTRLAEHYTTAQVWASALSDHALDGLAMPSATQPPRDGGGNVIHLALPADRPASIVVYSAYGIHAFAFGVFLVCAAGAIWLRPLPLRWLAGACLLAGGVALLIAQPFSTVVSGGFWGMLLGGAFVLARRGRDLRRPSRGDSGAATTVSTAPAAGAVGFALACRVLPWRRGRGTTTGVPRSVFG